MGKINWNRVILGGLAAGVVVNVITFLASNFLYAQELAAVGERLGDAAQRSGVDTATLVVTRLATGIFAVWLYAAIRPRFGAGPKTALSAGFAVWVLAWLANAPTIVTGLYPAGLLAMVAVVSIVNSLASTLLGAWLYKEEAAPAAVSSAAAGG